MVVAVLKELEVKWAERRVEKVGDGGDGGNGGGGEIVAGGGDGGGNGGGAAYKQILISATDKRRAY
jgi:hypothetical protein